jgi:hypothetical protein
MPPKRKLSPTEGESAPAKAPKTAHILNDLLVEFRDLKSIEFELFQPKPKRSAKALLPSNFLS